VLGNGVGRTGVEEEGAVLSNLSQGRWHLTSCLEELRKLATWRPLQAEKEVPVKAHSEGSLAMSGAAEASVAGAQGPGEV
jgi:hypothetical protein